MLNTSLLRIGGTAALVLLLAGCLTEPGEERVPGVLRMRADPVRIELPDTVAVGTTTPIRLTTYGGGCHRKGETEVSWNGEVLEIRPYDYLDQTQEICTRNLVLFDHEAEFTPGPVGDLTVHIHGLDGTISPPRPAMTVERTVVVVP